MTVVADADQWEEVDRWWDILIDSFPFVLASKETGTLDLSILQHQWGDMDTWWDTYVDGYSLVQASETAVTLDDQLTTEQWSELDSWWETHVESQHEALVELKTMLEDANKAWASSNSSFDADPLATDWKSNSQATGPLRTNQEENWSQWLAHLIRSGPPQFSHELFGTDFENHPTTVQREAYHPDPGGTDRYADILLFYEHLGVSIEVKKGDEHYTKTIHTASLIESQHSKDWTHFLLLPERKTTALSHSFPEEIVERDGRLVIESDQTKDITVLFWRDISYALRQMLQDNSSVDTHWEASAYLFCTLIEQKISKFVPQPVIDRLSESEDVVQTESSVLLSGSVIPDQTTYLRETMESRNNE